MRRGIPEAWECGECKNRITIEEVFQIFDEVESEIKAKHYVVIAILPKQVASTLRPEPRAEIERGLELHIESNQHYGQTRETVRRVPIPKTKREEIIEDLTNSFEEALGVED